MGFLNLYFYVVFEDLLPKYAAGPEPEPHRSCQPGETALQRQAAWSPASPPAVPVRPRSPGPPGATQVGIITTPAAPGPAVAGLPLHSNLLWHKQQASSPCSIAGAGALFYINLQFYL